MPRRLRVEGSGTEVGVTLNKFIAVESLHTEQSFRSKPKLEFASISRPAEPFGTARPNPLYNVYSWPTLKSIT